MSAIRSLGGFSARSCTALFAIPAVLAIADPASGQVDGALDSDFGGDGVVLRTDLLEEYWLTDLAAGDDAAGFDRRTRRH